MTSPKNSSNNGKVYEYVNRLLHIVVHAIIVAGFVWGVLKFAIVQPLTIQIERNTDMVLDCKQRINSCYEDVAMNYQRKDVIEAQLTAISKDIDHNKELIERVLRTVNGN
jgi:hypothetical protein